MEGTRKTVRSTSAQLNILVEYMVENPFLAAGEFSGPLGAQKLDDEWVSLAARLSNHGPHKTVQQWKHTWRDLKKKARTEGLRVLQAYSEAEAGNSDSVPILSNQSQKILKAIGHECATSIEMAAAETGIVNYAEPDDYPPVTPSWRQLDEDKVWRLKKRKTTVYASTLPVPSPSTTQPYPESSTLTTTPIIYYETSDNEKEKEVPAAIRKKPRHEEKNVDAIDIIKELRTARDEFDVFGEHVAMKVRNLTSSHAKHTTQYLINNILYNAAMGEYDSPSFNPVFAISGSNRSERSAVSETSASPSAARSSVNSPSHSVDKPYMDIKVEIADD